VNVVDSSAWLEYFAGGPNASYFALPIERPRSLLVPSIILYEVFKKVLQERGEDAALQAVAAMHQGTIVDFDAPIALLAARASIHHRLPMADSIILATSRTHNATLWTQDADFEGMPGVRYRPKA
jgi:toxin FitB